MSVQPISITTTAGIAPVLPSVVTAVYSDQTTVQLPVVWNSLAPSQYSKAGTFQVYGTVVGTDLQAEASITVLPSTDDSTNGNNNGSTEGNTNGNTSGNTSGSTNGSTNGNTSGGTNGNTNTNTVVVEATADANGTASVQLSADALAEAMKRQRIMH